MTVPAVLSVMVAFRKILVAQDAAATVTSMIPSESMFRVGSRSMLFSGFSVPFSTS